MTQHPAKRIAHLASYMVFEGRKDHGDLAIQAAQDWVATQFSVANPLEEMVRRTGLTERTFKRRFTSATGPLSGTEACASSAHGADRTSARHERREFDPAATLKTTRVVLRKASRYTNALLSVTISACYNRRSLQLHLARSAG